MILEEKEKELRLNQLKHKEIIRLVNTHDEPKDKDNKEERRVVNRKGREAPKMEGGEDEDIIEENPHPKAPARPKKKEYGFSSKNEDD